MTRLHALQLSIVFLVLIAAAQSGWALWVPDGVGVCSDTHDQLSPRLVSDGSGGAIITWEDYRSGSRHIYVQRVDALGNALWTENGVAVCTTANDRGLPLLVSDGAGGAIIAWPDYRTGRWDIYAQRVNASGVVQWTTNGIPLCTAGGNYENGLSITSDGDGGAIIAWAGESSGWWGIYAQRVGANGDVLWTANGVVVCTPMIVAMNPTTVSDGAGGAIIVWIDERGTYIQRVDASGNALWTENGVHCAPASGKAPVISDGAGGAIITWEGSSSGYRHIYAQRVDTNGNALWTANGIPICTAANEQMYPQLVSDGMNGAIIAWEDYRPTNNGKIYAQRVNASGSPLWAENGVAICNVGESREPQLVSDAAGGAIIMWCFYNDYTDIYAQRVNGSGNALWATNGVAICTAPRYQQSGQLIFDGLGGATMTWADYRSGNGDIYAQRIDDAGRIWVPPPPKTPCGLAGTPLYINNSVVALLATWNRNMESDISHYNIYRDSNEDFTPGPTNLLASPNDTFFCDVQWRWNPCFCYKVSAVDSEGKESNFARLCTGDITAVDGLPTAKVVYLAQNSPNPFNPSTEIRYYLPERCSVRLDVYDITGALVTRLTHGYEDRGNHGVSWNGRDRNGRQVSSGVYFYRLKAGKTEISKKMVLAR